jgi:hypothetical protein
MPVFSYWSFFRRFDNDGKVGGSGLYSSVSKIAFLLLHFSFDPSGLILRYV